MLPCGHIYRRIVHMVKRLLFDQIKNTKKSILLLGPRQSGKSTLLEQLKPDLTINLAGESDFMKISTDLDYFESLVVGKKLIFVDEVQRIPGLLNTIQKLIDKEKKIFLLSGSSARKLKRGQANLLPGRVFIYNIAGLCLKELNYNLDLKNALSHGFLPEPYLQKNTKFAEKLLQSYAHTYLKEEIQAESLTRNLQGFMRFLNVIAESSGEILDFSKISSKSKVSRSSITRFIEILEDTLVGHRVEVFAGAPDADTIKHPKFYFFDPGVLNGLLYNFTVSGDRKGRLLESLIFSQLRNSAMALDENIEISYFRTRHDVEVDFIIKWRNKHYAIEVKSDSVNKQDLSGLKIFANYFKTVHKCFVVSLKEKTRTLDGITICGVVELFKELGM